MGIAVDIFISSPPDSCICAICHDVLRDAVSIKECGHTFCEGCVVRLLPNEADDVSCPSCRVEFTDTIPSLIVRDLIGSMEVKCSSTAEANDSNESTKRQKGNAGQAVSGEICSWTGKCEDLAKHEDVCELKVTCCNIEGCNHQCRRKDMSKHLSGEGVVYHMNLMKQSFATIISSYDEKLKSEREGFERRMAELESRDIQMRYANDCREWIEYKPDALYDVLIFKIREKPRCANARISGLVCYIPGPSNSPWEGAMIPMILRYSSGDRMRPPKCKVPAEFFHANAYPSGTVCVSTLNEEEGWRSDMTFPEILFTVQAWLSHPNFNSPASSSAYNLYAREGVDKYRERVREEAKMYSNYIGHHPKVRTWLEGQEQIDEIDIMKQAEETAVHNGCELIPQPRKSPPEIVERNGRVPVIGCMCSCCAWGQKFWDEKRKMRYLFGL